MPRLYADRLALPTATMRQPGRDRVMTKCQIQMISADMTNVLGSRTTEP